MRILLVAALFLLSVPPVWSDSAQALRTVLERPNGTLDLGRLKLEVDKLIDPTIDVERELARLDKIVSEVEALLPPMADSWTRLQTLRQYIYVPGSWNGGLPFRYDHDDPYGKDIQNKLLPGYLNDRQGNCVTMPILVIILGQRLGLDMTAALAPLHVLVKWTDDQGVEHNLEATSGAGRTRESHYRKQLPISDLALESGIYLRGLSDNEVAAVIAMPVVEHLMQEGRNIEAMRAVDVILERYPDFAYALVKKGTIAYRILQSEFHRRYTTAREVPPHLHARLRELQNINQVNFDRAVSLGWKPEPSLE